jgi:hypothetical protein
MAVKQKQRKKERKKEAYFVSKLQNKEYQNKRN